MRPDDDYGDLRKVRQELEASKRLFAAHPRWTVLDITGKAVEETAATILETWRGRYEPTDGGAAGKAP
jgi:regulator of PEP synthase PpsR (kinase-PPPase family)